MRLRVRGARVPGIGPVPGRAANGRGSMADRILFIGWGTPVRGAEERGLEVFNEAIGILGRRQQEGQIEGFDVCLLAPNSDLNGYITVRGNAEQIAALRTNEEFLRNSVDASLIVDDFRQIEGYTNEGVAEMMAIYQEAAAKVPQRA